MRKHLQWNEIFFMHRRGEASAILDKGKDDGCEVSRPRGFGRSRNPAVTAVAERFSHILMSDVEISRRGQAYFIVYPPDVSILRWFYKDTNLFFL